MDIPLNGTLPRCPHGVYQPQGHKIAYACGFCNSDHYNTSGTGQVPVFTKQTHHDPELPFANKGYVCKSHCPKCNSSVHYVNDNATWTCADCDHKWKGRAE